jgi:hypothetical protein
MTLTTEDMGDVPDVDVATLDEVLGTDAFGKFAILSKAEKAFIQAGNDWQAGAECKATLIRGYWNTENGVVSFVPRVM